MKKASVSYDKYMMADNPEIPQYNLDFCHIHSPTNPSNRQIPCTIFIQRNVVLTSMMAEMMFA